MQSEWKSNHVQWIKTSSECGHGTKHLVSCKKWNKFNCLFTESYCYCRDEVWGVALDTRQGSMLAFYLTDLTSEPENTLAHFKTGETAESPELCDQISRFFFFLHPKKDIRWCFILMKCKVWISSRCQWKIKQRGEKKLPMKEALTVYTFECLLKSNSKDKACHSSCFLSAYSLFLAQHSCPTTTLTHSVVRRRSAVWTKDRWVAPKLHRPSAR